MSFAKKIFDKEISELNVTDLKIFFESEQEETSVLEFKSGDVEIIDLYKEISAFLNTEGGLLIIGSPQERKELIGKNTKTYCKGELTYSKFRNKDWLYQKIASNIVPSPSGLKIYEHIDSSGSIFVIDVPQSTLPPHQCSSDGRYYIRMEREAKPAPHGLVQALFQKRRFPKLDADIEIVPKLDNSDYITVSILNKSNIPADKVSCIIDIYNVNDVKCRFGVNARQDYLGYKFYITANAGQVLVRVLSFPIDINLTHKNEEYVVCVSFWCLDADFDFKFWTYNPQRNEIVCEDRLQYEKVNFIDEIVRVTKIKLPDLDQEV